jgi:hypothetical protein
MADTPTVSRHALGISAIPKTRGLKGRSLRLACKEKRLKQHASAVRIFPSEEALDWQPVIFE